MAGMDKDLGSIQEARDLALQAYEAQRIWAKASQEQVDRVCRGSSRGSFSSFRAVGTHGSRRNRLWRTSA